MISCTVSNVELAPLAPLAGVRMPGTNNDSSVSVSFAVDLPSDASIDWGVRSTLIAGTSSSLRGESIDDLVMGGGERSLGDTGQRGVSFSSGVTEDFWGVGARMLVSDRLGCRLGMEVADSALWVAAAEGGLLDGRDGLTSCALFFLARPGPDKRVERTGLVVGLTGEGSREGIGEFAADGVRLGRDFFV